MPKCPICNGTGEDPKETRWNQLCLICKGTGWIASPVEEEEEEKHKIKLEDQRPLEGESELTDRVEYY